MSPIYIIAIDLGGTITKIGLFEDGKLIDHIKMNSRPDLNMATSLPRIEKSINLLMDSNKVDHLSGIGIAFPGLVNNKENTYESVKRIPTPDEESRNPFFIYLKVNFWKF